VLSAKGKKAIEDCKWFTTIWLAASIEKCPIQGCFECKGHLRCGMPDTIIRRGYRSGRRRGYSEGEKGSGCTVGAADMKGKLGRTRTAEEKGENISPRNKIVQVKMTVNSASIGGLTRRRVFVREVPNVGGGDGARKVGS